MITEQVTLHPDATLTTMKATDFAAPPAGTPAPAVADFCVGSSTFVVGMGLPPLFPTDPMSPLNVFNTACPTPDADNRFYDRHISAAEWSYVNATVNGKTIACQQKYFCGKTQLPLNGTFKITRTFTADTYTPPPPPPNAPAQPVTKITITKVTE